MAYVDSRGCWYKFVWRMEDLELMLFKVDENGKLSTVESNEPFNGFEFIPHNDYCSSDFEPSTDNVEEEEQPPVVVLGRNVPPEAGGPPRLV
ncbi:hypothetical protein R1sor_023604 [Riccia sorocarpa]|uniref:Uncharacterized protein n=1 Tax=Riccia sorocarpa TaxID=122646 RepID=A0ABD3GNW2_9MARC